MNKESPQSWRRNRIRLRCIILIAVASSIAATAQDQTLQIDPQNTTVNFTLGDVLHTVRGSFRVKQGSLHMDASGKLTGEIVIDAKSGESGNGMRDRKMHREVLESDRYPEIVFRPDRVDGTVSSSGMSSIHVHGTFSIHGADHELSVPAEVKTAPGYWTATLHFTVPYAKWGMKNPSTLFLKVSESVDIDVKAAGTISRP